MSSSPSTGIQQVLHDGLATAAQLPLPRMPSGVLVPWAVQKGWVRSSPVEAQSWASALLQPRKGSGVSTLVILMASLAFPPALFLSLSNGLKSEVVPAGLEGRGGPQI